VGHLKTVYQQTETDCGAAAVATLCNVTYEEAAKVVYHNRKVGITASGRLLDAIKYFGGEPLESRCTAIGATELPDLDNDALLKCQLLHVGKAQTHWAAWDSVGQTIRDPYGYAFPLKVTHFVQIAWRK